MKNDAKNITSKKFLEIVDYLLKNNFYNQKKDIANALNMDKQALYRIEQGITSVTIEQLENLKNIVDVDYNWLFSNNETLKTLSCIKKQSNKTQTK